MSLPLIPLGLLGQGGTLAFPTLRATSNFIDNTVQNSHNVTLPSGTTTGDLVILFGYFGGLSGLDDVNVDTPSGWARIGHFDSGTAAEVNIYATIASGPLSSVTLTKQPSDDAFTAYTNGYSFSAHSHDMSFLPEVSSIGSQTTQFPDPPSLALPGDWGASPHVTWLSCVFRFLTNTTSAVSAGYGDLVTTGDGATRMMSARRNLIATTEDPGAWTTSASAVAIPFTIGVRGPE